MPDSVSNENGEAVIENTVRINQIEAIIKKYDDDISQISAQIEDIERQIGEKESEIARDSNGEGSKVPKVFTRKELKKLMEEREAAKEKKLLDLKNSIDIITRSEFEEAKLIREEAKQSTENQKKSLESKALEIEINALKKEYEVKSAILNEKQEKSRDVLADKISEELKIEKLRKTLRKLQIDKQDNGIAGESIRSRINTAIANKNHFAHYYEKLNKQINEIFSKLYRSRKMLKNKMVEAEKLKD